MVKLGRHIISSWLIVVLILTLVTASEAAANTYTDTELARAVTLGIGEFKADDPAVTYAEFFTMLDRVVELENPGVLNEWMGMLTDARESSRSILRCEAMLALYFAAEMLGPDYVGFHMGGAQYIQPICERLFPDDVTSGMNDTMNVGDYYLFPDYVHNPDKKTKYDENFYVPAAYYTGTRRLSLLTYKPFFELDNEAGSFRPGDALTYIEALLAAIRLYESVLPPESPRVPAALDEEILAKADARREAIRNTPTTVTITGTAYYVSSEGNDKNNGKSPEKPWKTLDKVHKFKFKPGDGVFFKRGDLWRFQRFDAQEGVTYSAYGEGEKPRFYGSPENGADPSKWSLVKGTNNVWVYHKKMRDCGAIVFNDGEEYAQKAYLYWNGKHYVTFTSFSPMDNLNGTAAFRPEDLDNLHFYNDIDYSKAKMRKEPSFDESSEYFFEARFHNDLTGKLYLRCDAGNPGDVFESIEFCIDRDDTSGWIITTETTGVTIDNLCLKYAAHGIGLGMSTTMQYNTRNFSKGAPNIVQNCEIGWMAGSTGRFSSEGFTDYTGDGMHIEGSNNTAINNYVYECQDCGIPIEVSCTYKQFGSDWNEMENIWENLTIKENLVEYCNAGIFVLNWEAPEIPGHLLRNVVVDDNIVLYSGYGHSGKRSRDLWSYYDRTDMDGSWGYALSFFGPGYFPNANDGFYVRDNIFYLSTNSLINCGMPQQYYPSFSGNIYVQNNYGRFAFWRELDDRQVIVNMARPDIVEYVKTMFGDETAVIASVSE